MVGLIGIPLAILSLMLEYACAIMVMDILEVEYCDVVSTVLVGKSCNLLKIVRYLGSRCVVIS